MSRGRCSIVAGVAFETRDAGDERGERGGRADDEQGERVGAPAGLQKPLAQVEEVTSRLNLAGAAHVGGIHRERCEWVDAGDDDVIREDRAKLERERVEGLCELVIGNQQRRCQPGVVPGVNPGCAGAEILGRHRIDHRQRMGRRRVIVCAVAIAV